MVILQWAFMLVLIFVVLMSDLFQWCASLAFGEYVKRKDREWCGKDT